MSDCIFNFAMLHLFLSAAFLVTLFAIAIHRKLGYTKGDWKWILFAISFCLFAPYWLLIVGFVGMEKRLIEMIDKMKLK